MKNAANNVNATFTTLWFIYASIFVAPLVFLAVLAVAVSPEEYPSNVRWLVTYASIFLAIGAPAIGLLLYRGRVKGMHSGSLTDKLNTYVTASVIRWACFEAPMLLAALAWAMSGLPVNLVLFGALLIGYLFTYPSRTKFVDQFHLTLDEKDRILSGRPATDPAG